jgi:hypothetical protein
MINYVIYGHTDYLDVLNIQTDQMNLIDDKILFLNKNELEINDLYSKYKDVFFYDDSKLYPQRLSQCLNQINYEYILFFHDIDLILSVNNELIDKLTDFLSHHKYDRIDLAYAQKCESPVIYQCPINKNVTEWVTTENFTDNDDLYLIKQTNPSNFIYNVNPSIWKRKTLIEIVDSFPSKTYRTIEDFEVQVFCEKYNIFKIHSKDKKECGHFHCINGFVFFHVTHNGSFVPLNEKYSTIYGQSYHSVQNEYEEIFNKYNLKNTNKWKY